MFWNVVKDGELTYAEHYINGRVLYDLCIDDLADNATEAALMHEHISDKPWAGKDAANELRMIVEKFRQESELG